MERRWAGVVLVTLLFVLLMAPAGWAQGNGNGDGNAVGQTPDHRPDGKGIGTIPDHQGGAKVGGGFTSGTGIYYHGGPVILGGVNVYYIWYGNWSYNSGAATILDFLASNIGGSGYFNINTTYYSTSLLGNNYVTNKVTLAGSSTDNYSQGTSLSDAQIESIVQRAINSGALGNADPNGVYFVLSSKDVHETSGFCTRYCGWHTSGGINGADVKYAFVGDPAQCPNACAAQWSASPNNNPSADAMASVIAHELEESTTDPDLNAWYDRRGYENADKCAWNFGATSLLHNGAYYNMVLPNASAPNKLPFLIQQNWVNAGSGGCRLSY